MATNYPHRDNKTLLPGNSEFHRAFNIGNAPVINAAAGGQYGYAPNNYRYVQEQPYVSQRPYCVVLSTPAGFNHIPGGSTFHGLLRAYMETRSRNWTGLTARTSVEYQDVTWAGGATLSFPTGATRQFGAISHNALDPEGESFSKLMETWVQYLIHDPVILHPKAITLNYPGDLLLDEISMASIYFEPTRNFKEVRHAALVLAQMPRETPSIEMSFDIDQTAGRIREVNTEFTGLIEFDTYAAKQIAKAMMQRMPLYNPDGRDAPPGFKTQTATLQGLRDNGVQDLMQQEKKTVVRPDYIG